MGTKRYRKCDCDSIPIIDKEKLFKRLKELARASLIYKGMIYSPSYGEMAFTVPLFDEFMCRAMPDFTLGALKAK